jgi:hypothetical protein
MPDISGLQLGKKKDYATGNTTRTYAAGPLNVSQTTNAQGQTVGSNFRLY